MRPTPPLDDALLQRLPLPLAQLYRRAHTVDPHISIATVYRTVRLFEEAGILAKHDFGDGRARYEETPQEHHDHLIDIQSGKVVEFHNDEIEELLVTLHAHRVIVLSALTVCASDCYC